MLLLTIQFTKKEVQWNQRTKHTQTQSIIAVIAPVYLSAEPHSTRVKIHCDGENVNGQIK